MKYTTWTVDVEAIQKQLPASTALLEYHFSEDAGYVFYLDKNELKLYTLPYPYTDLQTAFKGLRRVLSDYDYILKKEEEAYQNFTKYAHELYNKLIKPVLSSEQQPERLLVVTDRELGHLPFEVFLTKPTPKEPEYTKLPYLLHDYQLSYSYSAALWLENQPKEMLSGNGKILGFAPIYEHEEAVNLSYVQRSPQLRQLREV